MCVFLRCMYLYFMCIFCIHVCAPCTCSSLTGQKRAFELLELEVQQVVSHHTDARNTAQVFSKSNKYF